MTLSKKAIDLFEYLDYHELLRDLYQYRHKENRSFSYRYIGGKMDLDSGSISRILGRGRNLDPEMAGKMARIFGMDDQEKDYFETLVHFSQAKSNSQKNFYLERIFRLRAVVARTLEAGQSEFYAKWYHLAIWTLLKFYPSDGNPKKIGEMLRPAISPQEAQKAIDLLVAIGLVDNRKGALAVTDSVLASGEGIQATYLNRLHQEMGKLALQALGEVNVKERDFSGMTLTLSARGFDKVRDKLKQYRRELMEIARNEEDANCAFRMNLQLFPLTRQFLRASR